MLGICALYTVQYMGREIGQMNTCIAVRRRIFFWRVDISFFRTMAAAFASSLLAYSALFLLCNSEFASACSFFNLFQYDYLEELKKYTHDSFCSFLTCGEAVWS